MRRAIEGILIDPLSAYLSSTKAHVAIAVHGIINVHVQLHYIANSFFGKLNK